MTPTTRRGSGPAPQPIPPEWQPILSRYIMAMHAAGRPRSTVATRNAHLCRLARALGVSPQDVTGVLLQVWFASQTQWKQETRRSYRNSVSGFFGWANREGHLPTNPASELPTIRPDSASPRPAPDRVWKLALLRSDLKVALMLRLAAEAGLRRAEVAQVHTRDLIEGFDGPQLLVHGKGNRERVVPITEELAERIAMGAAGHTSTGQCKGWLFPGDDEGHLSPRYVGKLCADAMPDQWTMHSLRHRFATRAYRGTRNLRAVQTLLGHASVAVTERYTAVDDGEVRAAMNAAARGGLGGIAAALIACLVLVAASLDVMHGSQSPGGCYPTLHGVEGLGDGHSNFVEFAVGEAGVVPCA